MDDTSRLAGDDIFTAFTERFGALLQEALAARGIDPTPSVDRNIDLMNRSDRATLRATLTAAARVVGDTVPTTRVGDRMVAFRQFVLRLGRVPRDRAWLNDVLYAIKTTDEIFDPLRVFVSDKEYLKLYVKAVVGDAYNVPTLDVIRTVDSIDGYDFPESCCIKPTHASGHAILRRNGAPIDRETITGWFALNYYRGTREANYRTLRPKVIVEPLVFDDDNIDDYKIFCFRGRPRLIQVDVDRYVAHKRKFFDVDWVEQDFSIIYPKTDRTIERPANLPEMLDVASRLSRTFSLVRVDLYSNGRQALVGEITNCSESAGGRFVPRAAEAAASALIFS